MPLWIRILTIITFCCALAGLITPFGAMEVSPAAMFAPEMLPGMLFFLAAMVISVLTWRRTPGGVFLMLLLQLLQVVSISGVDGRAFVARCGPVMEVMLAPGGYRVQGGLQVLFADLASSSGLSLIASYSTVSDSMLEIASFVVGINLLPLFLAIMLWIYLGQPAAQTGPVAST